jgi:hypothetical protein
MVESDLIFCIGGILVSQFLKGVALALTEMSSSLHVGLSLLAPVLGVGDSVKGSGLGHEPFETNLYPVGGLSIATRSLLYCCHVSPFVANDNSMERTATNSNNGLLIA